MRFFFALLCIAITVPALGAPDLNGTWVLTRGGKLHPPALTEYGRAFKDSYDFKNDDPSLLCVPASWTRVFSNPNTPLEFTQSDDGIRMRHELFDIDRIVAFSTTDQGLSHQPGDLAYPTLGDSVAWYDGDDLLVHTVNYGDEIRVLSTIRNWAGVPQSPLMVTIERYRREGDQVLLDILHFDPIMYTEPLQASYRFRRESEWAVENYDCEPEDAMIVTPDQTSQAESTQSLQR